LGVLPRQSTGESKESFMQLKIVQPHDRWQYSRAMMEMHSHRKQIFVDRLGWDLPARGSWLRSTSSTTNMPFTS
jgi:hypothetical protein